MLRLLFWFLVGLLFLAACRQPAAPPAAELTATPTLPIGVSLQTVAPPTAVVQQTTPTPLPPPTATPSPTPVVYQVVEGDTLLAIALQQGVTVEEILALNPGLNPDFLSIGQVVTLPPRPTAIAQSAVGTAVPLQISVSQLAMYRTPVGGLWVLGLLRNDGDRAVENVRAQIELVDAAGSVVGSQLAWAALPITSAGESVPFGALFVQALPDDLQPVVAVVGGQTVVDLGSRTLDLAVVETAVDLEGDRVVVSGGVRNDGAETAAEITLLAVFLNGTGDMTGFQLHRLPVLLPSGETADFSFAGAPPGGQTVRAVITAQGQKVDP